jgi:predicted acyltransferase
MATQQGRLASVDALRGLTVAAMLLVNNAGDWSHVYAPLEHADWNGCTPTDLIFPFFLFIVGVSLSLGIGPRLDAGGDTAALRRGVLARALRIVVLGLVLHAASFWLIGSREHFRPMGVLQRIGICFAAAGLIAIETRPRTQWLVIAGILLGYWGVMAWGGPLTREGNLASRIDTLLLGRFAYEFDPATRRALEPEGWLSTVPAIATTLLGVRAGEWLRRGQLRHLWVAAAVAVVVGWLWSLVFPLNKQLWTSSYVLWTGGWALVALGFAHVAIDRLRVPPIGRSFGVNAIAAYAGSWLMVCVLAGLRWMGPIYEHGFAWMTPSTGPHLPSMAFGLAVVAVWWIVVVVLDRRRIHFKV